MQSEFEDAVPPTEINASSKPDFLCIGAQKAATSWLNKVLLEHPQVFMPPVNELHFFNRVDRDMSLRERQFVLANRAIKREKGKRKPNKAYIDYITRMMAFPTVTADWYRTAYSWPVADGVRKGDITPAYLELPESRVAYAREFLGPAKLIVIVRRPADRLLSQMRMWAGRGLVEDPTEKEWLDIMQEITRKETRGSYSRGIPLWRSYFGEDNMLVIPFSDIRNDPQATIDRVQDYIGVPRYDNFSLLGERIHASKKYEMSDKVKRAAEALTWIEEDYLRTEFGDEFFDKTR